jgi:hypothetical protein
MSEKHGVERNLTVKNSLRRYYKDFDYCNCNSGDSPHGAIPLNIKPPTTYLDSTMCTSLRGIFARAGTLTLS